MGITFSRSQVDLEHGFDDRNVPILLPHTLFSLTNTSLERHKSRRKSDDIPRSSRKRRKSRGASRTPFDFSEMLAAASMKPYDKPAPLYTDRNGGPMIRIRALQHMTIIHLRRV